jgi:hypothetical protein
MVEQQVRNQFEEVLYARDPRKILSARKRA